MRGRCLWYFGRFSTTPSSRSSSKVESLTGLAKTLPAIVGDGAHCWGTGLTIEVEVRGCTIGRARAAIFLVGKTACCWVNRVRLTWGGCRLICIGSLCLATLVGWWPVIVGWGRKFTVRLRLPELTTAVVNVGVYLKKRITL